ncbi:MAG TPA: ATP-binding protein [Anaerolineales bacterium]|nr:ATP-binding protein [Anaerolineales bacterium]
MAANLPKEYRSALKDFLRGGGERALKNAYMLGRRSLEQHIGVLDIVAAHHQALASLLSHSNESLPNNRKIIKQASDFLAECLSPFEMAQRGFQESIAALNSLNARLEDEVEKRTQEVRESEELYRTLIEISPDAITMTDLQGKVTLCNRQSALMHGYSDPDEAIGINAGEFVAPEDMLRMREVTLRVLHEGIIGEVEYSLIRKNGTRVPVEVRVTLVRDAAGKPSGFIGVNRDITERKQAQVKLELQARWQAAVAELGQHALSEVDLAALLHRTSSLVAYTLNVEFCELLELLPDGEHLLLRAGVGWKEGMVGNMVVKAAADSQTRYTLPRVEPIIVENTAEENRFSPSSLLMEHGIVSGMTTTIRGKGRPYGILGVHTCHQRNFTPGEANFLQSVANVLAMAVDNRRLLETEAIARQKAEKDNELRLKALAIVSHELRTPLTSIKGFATTLLADDVVWDADHQRDFISTINEEADKLCDLVEQLLDLSKMDAGVFKLSPIRQHPGILIAAAAPHLQALTGQGHSLIIDASDALPDVIADTQRIGQVLENLVENAAKYAPGGTAIKVSARVNDGFVEISVADEGPGVPISDREKVFQAFYRAGDKATLKVKGAGLGLTICRRLVDAQGGRIWIEQTNGPGTIICFTLPSVSVVEKQGER